MRAAAILHNALAENNKCKLPEAQRMRINTQLISFCILLCTR